MTDMKVGIKITADGKQTIGEVGRVVESVENIGTATYRAGRKASDGIISISTQLMRLQGLAAAGMGVSGLGDLVKLTDEYGQMASRIKMATDSVEEYEAVQARLLETASNTYRPLSEAQEMYLRTSDALKSLGYSTREALDVADSFSYLMVTNAASGERAAGAISAYSKALQKGRVDADAWQSILAATPTIVEKISSATGRTAEEIRKMGAEGKLALADLNEGLRQSLQQNMADAAKMPATVADAFTALRNSLQAYLGEANEATGLTQLFVGALESLAKNVDRLAKTGVAAAASAIAYLGIAAASATVKFGQMTAASMAAAGVQRAQAAAAVDVARAELAATEATIAHYSAIRVLAVSSSRMLPLYAARARAAAALAAAERNAQAAAAETSVLTQRMTLASVAANRLSVALGAVGAGFVGWEVGSWLRQFDLVKKIGNEVVEVLLDLWATQVFVAKALTMPWKISASWDEYIAKLKETRASMKAANEAIDAGLYDAGVGDDAAESLEQPSAAAEKLKEQMDAASEAARGLGISLAEFGPVVTPEFEKVTGQVDTL
ncbi:MAG: tape measure protein, partial [Zoogloeaceae bacterium]|nr:tape measure protein [Zoogloeaceae bacterium]